MEIIFALLVLLLIIVGLRNRKKEKKEWIQEERYEESGAWLDKRSGERGTYGSLDEEMEANRKYVTRQGQISELAQNIQSICFTQIPEFHSLSDQQIKAHLNFCKKALNGLFEQVESLSNGGTIPVQDAGLAPNAIQDAIKKQILDFSFQAFPKLLNLEIDQIRRFDQSAETVAQKIQMEISRL